MFWRFLIPSHGRTFNVSKLHTARSASAAWDKVSLLLCFAFLFFQQRSQCTCWVMVLISAKSKDASGGISPGCCSPLPHAGTGRAAGIGAPGSIKGCQGLLWAEEMRLGSISLSIYPAKTSLVYTGCFLLLLFLLPLPFFIREPSSKQNIPK